MRMYRKPRYILYYHDKSMTIDQQIIRSEAKDYFFLTIGLLIYAAAFTSF